MKVPKVVVDNLKKCFSDPEQAHVLYDAAIQSRLQMIDPEFLKELDELFKDIPKWYS